MENLKERLFLSVNNVFQQISFVSSEEIVNSYVEYFPQLLELTVSPKTSAGQKDLPFLLSIFPKVQAGLVELVYVNVYVFLYKCVHIYGAACAAWLLPGMVWLKPQ